MLLDNRSGAEWADFQLQATSDSLCLSSIRNNTKQLASLQNLLNGHRNGLTRNRLEVPKPSFTDLLSAARLIEIDHEIRLLGFKVGRRIIKSQMAIFTKAQERGINSLLRDQFAHTTTFPGEVRSLAVDKMEGTGPNAIDDSLL